MNFSPEWLELSYQEMGLLIFWAIAGLIAVVWMVCEKLEDRYDWNCADRCYGCIRPIIAKDDDARMCTHCGGRNRRKFKER